MKLVGACSGKMHVKSCGKRHAYCLICKPNRKNPAKGNRNWGFRNHDRLVKGAETKIRNGSAAGENNPNYRGGKIKHSLVGWNRVRRQVWERDKLCRVCNKLPHKNRRFDIHHRIPRRKGGTDSLENLLGVHHGCHMKLETGKVAERIKAVVPKTTNPQGFTSSNLVFSAWACNWL